MTDLLLLLRLSIEIEILQLSMPLLAKLHHNRQMIMNQVQIQYDHSPFELKRALE